MNTSIWIAVILFPKALACPSTYVNLCTTLTVHKMLTPGGHSHLRSISLYVLILGKIRVVLK